MKTTSETIGCDLGDKQSELFVLLPSGEVQRPPAVRTTKKGFRTFFARPPAHVIIEVGTHSRWVSTVLKELGHRVTVANPRRVQLISGSYAKSDTKDAELLARMGRADEQLLSPVEHRGAEAQADLAVPKARDVLVQVRTKLVNHLRVRRAEGALPCTHGQGSAHRVLRLVLALEGQKGGAPVALERPYDPRPPSPRPGPAQSITCRCLVALPRSGGSLHRRQVDLLQAAAKGTDPRSPREFSGDRPGLFAGIVDLDQFTSAKLHVFTAIACGLPTGSGHIRSRSRVR